ncbi:MAG: cell wall hydrolase [Firmicutes bacterium]|nr:cell wall hydrolase [Bacillota bacterium]
MKPGQIAAASILTLALLSQTLPMATAAPDVPAPPPVTRPTQQTQPVRPSQSTRYEPQTRPNSQETYSRVQDALSPSRVAYSAQDRELLARLIHSEAGGEPFLGQVAVGAVVLNRVKSSEYPDSISRVIYQNTYNPNTGVSYPQFQVVADGRIYENPTATSYQAADLALAGQDPTGGALGFYNPAKTNQWWVASRSVVTRIGNHVFFR